MTTANPQPLPDGLALVCTKCRQDVFVDSSGETRCGRCNKTFATLAAQGQLDKGELEALERVERGLMLTPLRRVGMGDAAIICAALRRTASRGDRSQESATREYDAACDVLSRLVDGLRAQFPDVPECDGDNVEHDVLCGLSAYIENLKDASRGGEFYRLAGWWIGGPDYDGMISVDVNLEDTIQDAIATHGGDRDDYTATELFVRTVNVNLGFDSPADRAAAPTPAVQGAKP